MSLLPDPPRPNTRMNAKPKNTQISLDAAAQYAATQVHEEPSIATHARHARSAAPPPRRAGWTAGGRGTRPSLREDGNQLAQNTQQIRRRAVHKKTRPRPRPPPAGNQAVLQAAVVPEEEPPRVGFNALTRLLCAQYTCSCRLRYLHINYTALLSLAVGVGVRRAEHRSQREETAR